MNENDNEKNIYIIVREINKLKMSVKDDIFKGLINSSSVNNSDALHISQTPTSNH